MAKIIRDACKAADPNIPFSVYSGYETDRTHWHYGVDWAKMREAIDWGIAGYNGGRQVIQGTMRALGDVPFTTGCMYVEKRFQAERPYPDALSWRIRLLRAVLDDEGMGFLVWYLPVLDGGGYWGISWVSALVADFEDFFTDFQRQDELVKSEPELGMDSLAVLIKGDERLVIVMNGSREAREVELRLANVPNGSQFVTYDTGETLDPGEPVALGLDAGGIQVLHLRPQPVSD